MTEKHSMRKTHTEAESRRSILLTDYMEQVEKTDELSKEDLNPVLLGLFGEVGSVMATAKKYQREKAAYVRYKDDLEEELGDTLWYFTALCRRLDFGMDEIFLDVAKDKRYQEKIAASDLSEGPLSRVVAVKDVPNLNELLLKLGETAAELLSVRKKNGKNKKTLSLLHTFADRYLRVVQAKKTAFAEIVRKNIDKTWGRFMEPDYPNLHDFDENSPEDERLPEKFRIEIVRRATGKSHMRWNGVFIGDPLGDNIPDKDGYRFHDVFHLSYAAILHWSPIFRGLIRRKRKSDPEVDENQDGGRARVVEEGVSAWIFSQAKDLDFFRDQDQVSFDLLKGVQNFVKGYEVEKCPLRLWERAILEGFEVFRQVLDEEGGVVIGDRGKRTISYEPLQGSEP